MPPTDAPTYHVLLTGYGPFSGMLNNPSWSCTKPLHNTIIQTPSGAKIHITALGPICVAYESVLKLIPLIHARPPRLPNPDEATKIIDPSEPMPSPECFALPPKSGYDLVLHLGAGMDGAATLEQIGRKSGYIHPDVDGKLLPQFSQTHQTQESARAVSKAELFERERLAGSESSKLPQGPAISQGFGAGYEIFPEELRTEVDVEAVIAGLKRSGETRIKASTDAGRYLCDFLCYGSLAESQRLLFEKESNKHVKVKRSKSLFMHVPSGPLEPFTQEELVELVRQVVAQICTGEKAL